MNATHCYGLLDRALYRYCCERPMYRPLCDYFDNPSNFLPITESPTRYINTLKQTAKRFQKIVLWGFRSVFDTYRFIHLGFFNTLKECGIEVVWIDDIKENNRIISRDDIVFSADICSKNLIYRNDAYYVLHNVIFDDSGTNIPNIDRTLHLKIFTYGSISRGEYYKNKVTVFSAKDRTLYQPWGTDVPPYRFAKPIFPGGGGRFLYWVGSVWDDKNHAGNIRIISQFKSELKQYGIEFIQMFPVSTRAAIMLIQKSRLTPAVAGEKQMEVGHLPCRWFKNISYGRLALSNVTNFETIFANCGIICEDFAMMLKKYFELPETIISEMIYEQQKITREHTYFSKLENIFSLI
ncbi:hypothetical protein FACS1894206_08880 [Deltaproteobacteria bacterium]|nr:hypothetical protein FACS1894206_08880 [Deltaproteobacteria bacterium]